MAKKKEKENWVAWLMHNYRITFLLVGVMFVMGFIGLDKMAKAEFPDFTIRQGVVVAVKPDASILLIWRVSALPLMPVCWRATSRNRSFR